LPIPEPSVVLEPVIVGFPVVPQHTPLAVTSAPPSDVRLPPDTALVWVIPETLTVLRTGIVGLFLQDCIVAIRPIEIKTIMVTL
jgi:hypothetical protein